MHLHQQNRNAVFQEITSKLTENLYESTANALLVCADSLEILKKIPSHSISLILTDPPYHSTKKENITNDKAFESDTAFLAWMEAFSIEWQRILRPNGSLFMFCSSAMSARLEVMMMQYFNVLSQVVWTKPNEPGFDGWKGKMKKEALRQWYPHSERIIFAEPATEGNLRRSSFGLFLKEMRIKSGLSGHQLTELTGFYGKVNHGGTVSNWEAGRNIPSREQYKKVCEVLLATQKLSEMPLYEDVIRPFEVNAEVEFTDVWNFPSVKPYQGKHPAEKPIEMLTHCIKSTTFEHDIVLDCFAGSGSTALAALAHNRKSISIEIEEEWVKVIQQRLHTFEPKLMQTLKQKQDIMKVKKENKQQTSLFA